MKSTPLVIIFAVFVCGANCSAASSTPQVLLGATVVNPTDIESIENATIVFTDGAIIAFGASGDVKLPPDAEIIDVRGKWVIPGLIDAHVHFFQSGGLYTRPDIIDLRKHQPYDDELALIRERLGDTFARYLRCGVTSVVDVGGPFWNFKVRDLARATPLAPRVTVAGPLASTYQPAALSTADPPIIKINSAAEARALVRQQAEARADLIKIWYIVRNGQSAQDNLHLVKATIDESHAAGIRVAVHATQLETARVAVQAGADILVHSITDTEIDDAFIQLLKQRGTIYTTSLVVLEGYPEVLSQQIDYTAEEYAYSNPYSMATLFDLRGQLASDIPTSIAERIEAAQPLRTNPVALRNLKRLHSAGVNIAVGTDAGNIGTLHGPAIFREFELMREAGLSPREILTAATLGGARVVGLADRLGSIGVGKLADLVVLNSDPMVDIGNTSDIYLVIKDGIAYRPEDIIQPTPADIVQRQVNAYNGRDLDAFLATYASDAKLYDYPDVLLSTGLAAMKSRYQSRFEQVPGLHGQILSRMTLGDMVIDYERVTGFTDGRVLTGIVIYRVADGLIQEVRFVRDDA